MLDKLKDIVPEVDETKAKLIYQKSKTSKSRVSFNYKLVFRFACLLIVLIPVLVIIGLSGKNGNVFEPNAPSFNGSATNKPGNEDAGDVHEYFYYNVYYDACIVELYFYDYYDVYYLKEYSNYKIISVSINGEEVTSLDSVYHLDSSVKVSILFQEFNSKVIISVSNDNIHFQDYCIYVK